jgi:hypothetical protein
MVYGPLPQRKLPEQNSEKLLLLAERWNRAAGAHEAWATPAKLAVDFVEGRQWTAEEIAKLEKQGRPALKLNKIGALIRLVLGFQRNNKTDLRAQPGHDGTGTEQVADALTRILKQISEASQLAYVDTEVFMDGLTTGRGFYDTRLDFCENDFGEVMTRAKDPFTIFIDPDATSYDLNDRNGGAGFVVERRWTNPDEVEWAYGKKVSDLVAPLARGSTPVGPILSMYGNNGEITPVRAFGSKDEAGTWGAWWDSYHSLLGDYVDPLRKNLAVLDFQYYVTERKRCFIDLETGDRSVIPDHWGVNQIEKCLWHASQVGNPLTIAERPVRRVRWTTIIGDVTVYDAWSPYDNYTLTGFYPWFRRGYTQGMVSDLIDPQREVNKRRSVRVENVMRTTNSGWKYHEDSLDPVEEAKLKRHGAAPGYTMKWKGDKEPKRIEPGATPMAQERLEEDAVEDIRQIAGINESALGELDRVQSGRAIEARQRQAVIALQVYLDNHSRSKELLGRKQVNLVQRHYTEPRIFRILGEDGNFVQTAINQEVMAPGTGAVSRLNDVTIGKYSVTIDERPFAATYASAQFEEALTLVEKLAGLNPAAGAMMTDILIDASTLPRKDELKERVQQAMGLGMPPGGVPGGPVPPAGPGAPAALDQMALPGGGVAQVPTGALPPPV